MLHKIPHYFSQDCKISHKWSKQACEIKSVVFFSKMRICPAAELTRMSGQRLDIVSYKRRRMGVNLIRNYSWCCLTINTDRNVANIVISSRGTSYLSSFTHMYLYVSIYQLFLNDIFFLDKHYFSITMTRLWYSEYSE